MDYCSVCKHDHSIVCASCSNYQNIPDHFEQKANTIRFLLDGCGIPLVAEAPEDMTIKQLLKQTDRILFHPCRGIVSLDDAPRYQNLKTQIVFDYEDVKNVDPEEPCQIK